MIAIFNTPLPSTLSISSTSFISFSNVHAIQVSWDWTFVARLISRVVKNSHHHIQLIIAKLPKSYMAETHLLTLIWRDIVKAFISSLLLLYCILDLILLKNLGTNPYCNLIVTLYHCHQMVINF